MSGGRRYRHGVWTSGDQDAWEDVDFLNSCFA